MTGQKQVKRYLRRGKNETGTDLIRYISAVRDAVAGQEVTWRYLMTSDPDVMNELAHMIRIWKRGWD